MMRKDFLFVPALVVLCAMGVAAQNFPNNDLTITSEDIRIEQRVDGGFHVFIRKKPGLGSVLLTESTRDPNRQEANYAYRTAEYNNINGSEIRILDGAVIPVEQRIYSIIDSTPEPHPELGQALHLYIPYLLYYGYENTRHGEIYVVDGAYFNLRAFSLPYADYRGSFQDNPYTLHITQKPLEGPPEGNYMKDTVDSFSEIAKIGNGDLIWSTGPADLVDKIRDLLDRQNTNSLDMVFCLDTTSSMQDDIEEIQKTLTPLLASRTTQFQSVRFGMVLYKDYFDEYLTRVVPFTKDLDQFQRTLDNINVGGGRDIPEAVYEALYDGATGFSWEAESRLLVLIGDAPPHPRQRGAVSKEMVNQAAAERGLKVNAIILPQ
ncbi:hypothetical protein FACS189491_08720 [Spirochaetia bacterium]|nr:hypothetical protein FACS189491_08720 [Spirochaetia bacterium]